MLPLGGNKACKLFFRPFYFVLQYSQLTRLCQLQVGSEGTQPYVFVHPSSPKLPSRPGCCMTLSRVPCAMRQALLVVHFDYGSVHTSIPNSLTIPCPSFPPDNRKFILSKSVSLVLFFKLICIVSLWIPRLKDVICYFSFSVRLTSLIMITSKSVHCCKWHYPMLFNG